MKVSEYIKADDFSDWYESYSITDAQREEAAQVARAVEKFRKIAPADVIPSDELRGQLYRMQHDTSSFSDGDDREHAGYLLAIFKLRGWIAEYGEDESGK